MAIESPPRPPSQDELDALIREARERQLRRRLLGAAAITITAAASLGIYAVFSAGSSRPPTGASAGLATTCPLSALLLSLQTQGTATQAVTFLTIRNPQRLTCSITAPVVFEITANGQRAHVLGNPLRLRLRMKLRGARSGSLWPLNGVWWANYCGSRKGLRMTARVGSRSIVTRFSILPDCLTSGNGALRSG